MILREKKFILRPARLSDAPEIYRYQQEPETKKNFMSVPKSVAEVKKDILKYKQNTKKKLGEYFVIDIDGKVAGEISFHFWTPPKKYKAILSVWVAKKHRGKGIATEATKLITKYAFKKYPLVRLEANVRTFNKPSARVLEKVGFKLEGVLRKNKQKGNKYYDDFVYAMIK